MGRRLSHPMPQPVGHLGSCCVICWGEAQGCTCSHAADAVVECEMPSGKQRKDFATAKVMLKLQLILVCLASCSTLWHHPRHLSCPCSLGTGVPGHCRAGVESRGVVDAALLSGLLTYACQAVYFNKGQLEMPLCPTAGRNALLHVQTLASHCSWAAACLIKPTRFGPPCTVLLRRTCGCVSTASKGPACAGCQ